MRFLRLTISFVLLAAGLAAVRAPVQAGAATATYAWVSVPAAGSTVAGVVSLTATSSDGSDLRVSLIGPDGFDQIDEKLPSGGTYLVETYRYTQGPSMFALSDGSGHYQSNVPVTISNPPPSVASFTPGQGGVVATPGPVSVVPVEPVAGLGIDSVTYSIDAVHAGFVDQPPWQITVPDLPPGPHLLSASVFDTGDRSSVAIETITTVRASVLTRTDTPHTATSGRTHVVSFSLTQTGSPPEPRAALGVTLTARPSGSTGAFQAVGHALSDRQGRVSFPLTTKRSLDLVATLAPVAGYTPASATGSLVVTTSMTCSAHHTPGDVGPNFNRGMCLINPGVNGREVVTHLGSTHGKILARTRIYGKHIYFHLSATRKATRLVFVLADGSYTAGATATVTVTPYVTPTPRVSGGRGTLSYVLACPPGHISTRQCTLVPTFT